MGVPAIRFRPELLLRAQGVQVAFLDVDGVMTDGGLYFTESGETMKRFHVLDGHGLKLLAKAGITPVVVTGRDSPALRTRLQALGLVHVYFGVDNKRVAAEQALQAIGSTWSAAAVIGDDWPDLTLMHRCVLACAPPNAHVEVRAVAHHVTTARGGEGAAREFCDLLLVAKGVYAGLLAEESA